ncbi:GNAT family N-acetyltransferase [Bacillus tianshenii]|nr:GNAT family N-acetyltransferase [Bacillus tianshenii]
MKTGTLTKIDGTTHLYEMRKLGTEHLEEIETLQQTVIAEMPIKEYCDALSQQELLNVLGERGLTLGVFVEGKCVGFHAVLFPGLDEENLGYDWGLDSKQLMQAAHLEIVLIYPEYRGNGLQQLMAKELLEMLNKMENIRYVFETVHPLNTPSVKNTLKHDVVIVELKEKYQGTLRYIFMQDLQQPILIDEASVVEVRQEDITKQQQLLKNGYVGFDLIKSGDKVNVLFAKKR